MEELHLTYSVSAFCSLRLHLISGRTKIRDWERKPDVKNKMLSDIDDLFYALKQETTIDVPYEVLTEFVETLFLTAQRYT